MHSFIDEALNLLAELDIDVCDHALISILGQCQDVELLKTALQVIADDVAESYGGYPVEHAVQIIFEVAVQPFAAKPIKLDKKSPFIKFYQHPKFRDPVIVRKDFKSSNPDLCYVCDIYGKGCTWVKRSALTWLHPECIVTPPLPPECENSPLRGEIE